MTERNTAAHILLEARRARAAVRRPAGGARLLLWLLVTGLALVAATVRADPLNEALRERVELLRRGRAIAVAGGLVSADGAVTRLYEARGFRPAWTSPERRQALLRAVEASADDGLEPADYQNAALRAAAAAPADDARTIADRDLLFTAALLRLAAHVHTGKVDPARLDPDWGFARRTDGDDLAALEALVDAPDLAQALRQWAPRLDAYVGLRTALARYRRIAADGGWPSLPDGPTLRPDTVDARVAILRDRLAITDDAPTVAGPDAERFDAALREALVRFQRRHGLETDGLAGRRTRAALNVDVRRRIDQIRVNLERLRWLAPELAGDQLQVDVAAFAASLRLDGHVVWSSRAIVGRPDRPTPSFGATLRYLVLNPEWVVPPTILRQDMLPRIIAQPAYLAEHALHLEDFAGQPVDPQSIEWARYRHDGFPFQLVQPPGPDNPVGRIKFVFPNPYSVYLHDTPAKALFDKPERAFSSGCIRLQRPLELALALLDDPIRWPTEALEAAITTGQTRTLTVPRQVPVRVLYLTATANADGQVDFRRDIYARDPAVLAALQRPIATPTHGHR
ncbi:L,D-transpeptidase family protein [Nitrogeniibacter mangrovi]|uniref:L,D-transpeptidase family protein n=1 Tax=Nitrogeniibacter mangrovi TaxID=2016596 RepID=A0A6C1B0C1_9RHOO|nr:L,D-transpeptidase family protein [Nitrogeniibacter mangrovi]QID16823.1 L,D-transpeptidase family protein [Nitrogeniibacter mangrovi]